MITSQTPNQQLPSEGDLQETVGVSGSTSLSAPDSSQQLLQQPPRAAKGSSDVIGSTSSASGQTLSNQEAQQTSPWSAQQLKILPSAIPSLSPFPRYGHALSATSTNNGEMYIFGGLVGESLTNDLFQISVRDLGTTFLQTAGEIPSPRVGHASALANNMLIVWGGDMKADLKDNGLYLLNLVSLEWTRVVVDGKLPLGRYGHCVTIAGPKFFVFGGQLDGEFFNDLWAFDLNDLPSKVSWELYDTVPPSERPAPRTGHVCIAYGDLIIVFGGTDGQYHYNDTWAFDINTRKWSELQCTGFIPSPREGHKAVLVDDFVYIFGGRDIGGRDLGDLTAFKISNQRWYMFQNIGHSPRGRSGHAIASIGCRVFVLGGESFTAAETDDDLIIHVLDTKAIKYPEPEPEE